MWNVFGGIHEQAKNERQSWMNEHYNLRKKSRKQPLKGQCYSKMENNMKTSLTPSNEEITNVGKLYRKMWLRIQIIIGCGFIHILTFFNFSNLALYTTIKCLYMYDAYM